MIRSHRLSGTSTVEMAIVLPLLLMLTFAIGEFSIAFTRSQTLTNATREGARTGVVFRNPCVAGTVTTQIQNTIATFAASAGITSGITTTATGVCAGTGAPLTVVTSVPFTFALMPGLAGLVRNINLGASSTMRNE